MKKLPLCIMVICLLMTSCRSSKIVTAEKTRVPLLEFPEFPKLKRTVNSDGSWYLPKESTDILAEFYEHYEEVKKNYELILELYEKDYE